MGRTASTDQATQLFGARGVRSGTASRAQAPRRARGVNEAPGGRSPPGAVCACDAPALPPIYLPTRKEKVIRNEFSDIRLVTSMSPIGVGNMPVMLFSNAW